MTEKTTDIAKESIHRILVVEDVPEDYELVLRQLRSSGIEFESVRIDAEDDLITTMQDFRPTLVLSDFALEGFDGLKALEIIRKQDSAVPFILVTGSLSEMMAFEAVKKGATDYVMKDRLERLPVVVTRALNDVSERGRLEKVREQAMAALRARQDDWDRQAARTIKILFLEDLDSDVALVRKELEKSGINFELYACDDEQSFREAIKQHEPDVLLADFQLPTFDGIKALQIRDELNDRLPFIFLSGIMGEELAIEAVKSGATDYVMKNSLFALPVAIKRAVAEVQERALRLEAERNLASSQINRIITDNTAAALFLLDEQQQCIFVNPSGEKMTQYSLRELAGVNFHDKLQFGDAIRKKNNGRNPAAQLGGEARDVFRVQDVLIRKDGHPVEVLYSASNIVTEGKVTGSVIECVDLSTEKAIERVSVTVQAINDELQTLSMVVSHELQEHVGKISSYLNLLSVRYMDRLGDDANEFLGICLQSAEVIKLMVDDLWTYARINKLDLEKQYVNCSKVMASTIEDFRVRIDELKATILYDKLPTIYSNERQISYLFRSLIDNSLKFHGKDPPNIKVSCTERDSMWIFTFDDNGIGIDPIHSRDVFKIFSRLNDKPGVSGTGMGLAICKKIVERNNGEIWFHNNPSGIGCTFSISMPSHVVTEK